MAVPRIFLGIFLVFFFFINGNSLVAQHTQIIKKKPFSLINVQKVGGSKSQELIEFTQKDSSFRSYKVDSSMVDSTELINKIESYLEQQVISDNENLSFSDFGGVEGFFPQMDENKYSSALSKKFIQKDFWAPKEKLEQARQKLNQDKKRYTSLFDSRVKEAATKRQSLKHLHFSQRLDYGALTQFNPNSPNHFEVHMQVGYSMSKKSTLGAGLRVNWQNANKINGLKVYYNRQIAGNFLWITEYTLQLNDLPEGIKMVDYQISPLVTGLGGDLRIRGRLYLRTTVLIPFGLRLLENPSFIKQSVYQFGLVLKPIK
ncbi:hypothetical protein MMU07_04540 [Aquiflexum sp. LQ15W]|uniref:hypothetical protein n=1 Tax=Cognataquiflexum nitidum TaxID=2922272 RepID=UPI001F12D9C2|nr:hypothetical protein [Cognataquiflexum nitidum]MCH6198832.1 hypothetical protein [Cognataquiflexum nitidum]